MNKKILCGIASMMITACASRQPLPEHTLILAEVVQVSASDQAEAGLEHAGSFERFPDELFSACGIAKSGADVRNLALVRFSYYWHNGGARVRETVRWYALRPGLTVVPGNLVEIELLAGADGPDSRCPWIGRILAEDIASGGCAYVQAEQGGLRQTLNLLNPVGAAGSASLDCPLLAASGWRAERFGLYGAVAWTRAPQGSRD